VKPYSWIKLSTDFFDDPKVLRLQTYPEKDFLLIFWIKIVLLSLRRNDGLLLIDDTLPYSVSDFVVMFRKEENVIRMALSIFKKLNMIVVKTSAAGEIIGIREFVGFTDVEGLEDARKKNREKQAAFRKRQRESLIAIETNRNEEPLGEFEDVTGYGTVTNQNFEVSNQKVTEQNRIDKIREEEKREENTSAPNDSKNESGSTHEPPREKIPAIDFDFSTGDFTKITERHLQIWAKAYPAVDISTELQRMAAWLIANPKNRKSNYARFITNWLTRAQDRAPLGPPSGGPLKNRQKTFSDLREENNQRVLNSVLKKLGEPSKEDEGGEKNVIDAL